MSELTAEPTTDDYRVQTEVFSGPLDLLLYLIRKEEVDIYDIPIARITRQYLRYVDMMKTLDLEVAGEFILMAATLIRIKTRLLLPQQESDSEEPDPREELIMALVEYKKYKEAGELLRERALLEERNYVPPSPVEKIDGRVDLTPVTSLYDLMAAFREVMTHRTTQLAHQVNQEEVSIEERMEVILGLLADQEFRVFTELFADIPRKMIAVVTFVAMLELVRSQRIRVFQSVPYSELRIYRGNQYAAPHREIDLVDFTSSVSQVTQE